MPFCLPSKVTKYDLMKNHQIVAGINSNSCAKDMIKNNILKLLDILKWVGRVFCG
jgi:hypothetical protein